MEFVLMIVIAMALAEIIKGLKMVDCKFIPLINLMIGICMSVAYNNSNLKLAVLKGIMIGLTASGLYSTIKNLMEGIKKHVVNKNSPIVAVAEDDHREK